MYSVCVCVCMYPDTHRGDVAGVHVYVEYACHGVYVTLMVGVSVELKLNYFTH